MIARPEERTRSLHPLNHKSEHNRYHTTIDESLHHTSDEPPTAPQERTQSLPYNERRLAAPHERRASAPQERSITTPHDLHSLNTTVLPNQGSLRRRTRRRQRPIRRETFAGTDGSSGMARRTGAPRALWRPLLGTLLKYMCVLC